MQYVYATGGGNKISAFMSSNGFGAKSSKGKPAPAPIPRPGGGGLSEAQLKAHNEQMEDVRAHDTMSLMVARMASPIPEEGEALAAGAAADIDQPEA